MRCQAERAPMTIFRCSECGKLNHLHRAWCPLAGDRSEEMRERQPSSDQVLVPREPTESMSKAAEKCYLKLQQDNSSRFWLRNLVEEIYRAMLSAAEAEKGKPDLKEPR